jgi:uncharacterized protein (TIRG00374 family)
VRTFLRTVTITSRATSAHSRRGAGFDNRAEASAGTRTRGDLVWGAALPKPKQPGRVRVRPTQPLREASSLSGVPHEPAPRRPAPLTVARFLTWITRPTASPTVAASRLSPYRRVQILLFIPTLLALSALGLFEHHQLSRSLATLADLDWWWLAPALFAEAISMVAFAIVHRRLLWSGGIGIRTLTVTAISFASNAISSSLPVAGSGIGTAYTFRQFQHRGADAVAAAWVVAVSGAASSLTFGVIVASAAIWSEQLGGIVTGLLITILTAVALGGTVLVLRRPQVRRTLQDQIVRGVHLFNRALRRQAPNPATVGSALERVTSLRLAATDITSVLTWSSVNWIADGACFALALAATRTTVGGSQLIFIWAAGATASSFLLTPGGLGVVETSMIAALVLAGTPTDRATAAVLVYRLISYWMVVVGGWAVFVEMRRRPYQQSR